MATAAREGGGPGMDARLDQETARWLQWDKNPLTLESVKQLIAEHNKEELQKCFGARMEFGTAGLRAAMGVGISHMNDLTIIQTTQPYTVLHLKLCAGIMITASHNPKQDNGYKVYWDNGAQIISPHDKGISQAIEENLEPWPQAWDDSLINGSPLPVSRAMLVCFTSFHDVSDSRNVNRETKLKFVHTSVHGVGHNFVQSAFRAFDFVPPEAVPEQKVPDPEFPTVKYPNPEEGKGVLTLSFALADKIKAKIILANDPDADRLAVAEKQDSGEWRVFSGNELGALLGWWLFTSWKEKNQDPSALKDTYMLSSTVSSKILRAIALKEGFHFEETLTGFKWMGNRAKQLIDQGKNVLFAFEEAIGYMCCPFVLDKDGVSAAVISAEMASFLATKNLSLSQQLKAIYVEYGYHITKASYFICHDQGTIKKLFENLRNYDGKNNYPKTCGKFEISGIRDLTTGYDDSQPDKKAVLPTSKSSQMITFTFANGCVATMRTSGTEPKIKYYSELCAPPGNSDPEQLKKQLQEVVSAIEEHFFQPQKYNLQPKAE
ncbi:PREDICTED: phosphoglucomutase-2 [Hipposideros armiger]|uniref:Phosphoglucomutase-2 n=1 Tax=Hipposideros armiger TaxID=186990 RepID=A0A8B7QUW3_HIPAR|nr:PREDICTED: phosphoglucomutase-2 [Hipposideros armiger]